MQFKIPNCKDIRTCLDSLCDWLDSNFRTNPIYKIEEQHNMKYLGYYIEVLEDNFQVCDLYIYSGSKFNPITFIARFGESDKEYKSEFLDNLKDLKNNDLKKFAVGEAYRRYKKRQPCKGFIEK